MTTSELEMAFTNVYKLNLLVSLLRLSRVSGFLVTYTLLSFPKFVLGLSGPNIQSIYTTTKLTRSA